MSNRSKPNDLTAKFVVSYSNLEYLRHIKTGGESVISLVNSAKYSEPIILKTMFNPSQYKTNTLREKQRQYFLEHYLQKEVLKKGGNVPKQIEVGFCGSATNRQAYMLMEKIGEDIVTLEDIFKQEEISPDCLIDYCSTVANTLNIVHSLGYVHGDIKPSNIFLDSKGECFVADFDLVRLKSVVDSNYKRGTISYMENEYIRTGKPLFLDQAALGIILFEGLTNNHVVQGVQGNHYFSLYRQYTGIENREWKDKFSKTNKSLFEGEIYSFLNKVLTPSMNDRYLDFNKVCKHLDHIKSLSKSKEKINFEKKKLVSKIVYLRKKNTLETNKVEDLDPSLSDSFKTVQTKNSTKV